MGGKKCWEWRCPPHQLCRNISTGGKLQLARENLFLWMFLSILAKYLVLNFILNIRKFLFDWKRSCGARLPAGAMLWRQSDTKQTDEISAAEGGEAGRGRLAPAGGGGRIAGAVRQDRRHCRSPRPPFISIKLRGGAGQQAAAPQNTEATLQLYMSQK